MLTRYASCAYRSDATCGLQYLLLAWALIASGVGTACADDATRVAANAVGAFAGAAPVRAPLDSTLVITGNFGERRQGHFHAGLDFSTGGRTGRAVLAPVSGWVERIRASGVGYGRSLYLHAEDGRLIVLGHLDGFEEPVASYVAGVQDSTGQYEQDLWPETGRFRVSQGQRVAWSGESGAGGPHLHMEIRRGDMALNPVRAGLAVADTEAPRLLTIVLEPLDEHSLVDGVARPVGRLFAAGADTFAVIGRLRVTVRARDGFGGGSRDLAPWSTEIEWNGAVVACRMDSVSWATDMVESDWVFDTGRIAGGEATVMWAPAGFRPRVLVADGRGEVGTIEVKRGDPPRPLSVVARDVAGHEARATIWLRPDERAAPKPPKPGVERRSIALPGRLTIASLPGERLRLAIDGVPAGNRVQRIALADPRARVEGIATRNAVVLEVAPGAYSMTVDGDGPRGPWRAEGPQLLITRLGAGGEKSAGGLEWSVPTDATFEPELVAIERPKSAPGGAELERVSEPFALHPKDLPLRRAITVRVRYAGLIAGVGLFRDSGSGWDFVRASYDSVRHRFEAETRSLGRFALFRDTTPPRIELRAPARRAPATPYPRWALEARLGDQGSGIEGRTTRFVVDGVARASEWDLEEKTLRWRPLAPLPAGEHRYEVIATDRCGNAARRAGTFVLD